MSTGTMRVEGTVLTEDRRVLEDQLVRDHLTLVHYVVSDMAGRIPRHVSRDDLESAGMAGLAQAARSFDPERGIAFERYAATRIRGALLDELRGRDWASRSVRCKARKLTGASEDLTNKLGRVPSIEEIADYLGMAKQAVQSINDDVHRAVVLNYDSVLADGDAEHIMPSDHSSPDVLILEQERRSYLVDAVMALPERLRRVVIGYFFEERPMHELADELGVSESRISQMRAEALGLLKDGINAQLEPDAVPDDRRSPRVARRKAAYYTAIAANSDFRSRVTIA
jgi:RNA polymerase sigma factor for flagellar operon FliA